MALLGAWMLAGCVDVVSTDPVPCWQPHGDFDFRPVTVEGVLQVDSEANGLFIRMPDGREYDIGFPDGYRVILESGTGRVSTPAGRTLAEAGDSLRLWGGDTHIGEEPIPPAPMGRRGLIVCMIDGQQVRDANGRTIGRS